MCGLYGFIGKPTKDTSSVIQKLGILNESRGGQSTGIALITKKNVQLYKKAVSSPVFFNDLQKAKHVNLQKHVDLLTVLGHTRLATHGDVTDKNAHPFHIGRIVFAHNGVITNFEELQLKHKTKYEVDSQIIGHLLDKKDKVKAFKKLSGMFAIPFVDLLERDMLQVAIHNQEFAYAYKGQQLYYSSDIKHLRQALQGKDFNICESGNNKLYKFYITGTGIAISKETIEAASSGYNMNSFYGYYQTKATEYNSEANKKLLKDGFGGYWDY